MPGNTSILRNVRREMDLIREQNTARWDLVAQKLEEIEARLDKLDKPRKNTRVKKLPVPIPERPELMKIAEVGHDPK